MKVIETRKDYVSEETLNQRDCYKIELTFDEILDLKSVLETIKWSRENKKVTQGCWWIDRFLLTTRDTRLVNNLIRKLKKARV